MRNPRQRRLTTWKSNSLGLLAIGAFAQACAAELDTEALPEGTRVIDGQREVVDQGFEITSELNPETGEPEAFNYVPAPMADEEGEFRGLSNGYQDVWAGPTGGEVNINMWSERALVGIGARVAGGAVTTLHLHGREVRQDGTLGSIREYRGGTAPNNGLEVWCEAPTNYLIVGVGGRIQNQNMTTLRIYYRRYNASTRTLDDAVYSRGCGSVPDNGLERRIVSWEVIPDPREEEISVINGISMREQYDNLQGLRARYRLID